MHSKLVLKASMCVQCNDFDVEKMDHLFVGRGGKNAETEPNRKIAVILVFGLIYFLCYSVFSKLYGSLKFYFLVFC
jgi:hypothetical protein